VPLSKAMRVWPVLGILLFTAGCATIPSSTCPKPGPIPDPQLIEEARHPYVSAPKGYVEYGVASWYGADFHGRLTSNGERYNMYGRTAAHRKLPFGLFVRVTRLDNGANVVVRINDRGPFVRGRCLDLSYGAAIALGLVDHGVAEVKIEVL